MVHAALKYAVLSTTAFTWFLKRDQNGVLYVSDAFAAETSGAESLRRAYLAVLLSALGDPDACGLGLSDSGPLFATMIASETDGPFARTLAGELPPRGYGQRFDSFAAYCHEHLRDQRDDPKDARERLLEQLPVSAADFVLPLPLTESECLKHGDRTIVERANTMGTPMVTKKWIARLLPRHADENASANAALRSEAAMYKRLRALQGVAIPFLIFAGRCGPVRRLLAVSDEGTTLDLLLEDLDEQGQDELLERHAAGARAALARLHAARVLHNNIATRNIVAHPERGVKLIDLELACEAHDEASFSREMKQLEGIFGVAPLAKRPRKDVSS